MQNEIDKDFGKLVTRVTTLEKQISSYKTAIVVAGAIFTGILGYSAKSTYDAVNAELSPALQINEQATVILEQMQAKRTQLDSSIESILGTREASADAALGEIETQKQNAFNLVQQIEDVASASENQAASAIDSILERFEQITIGEVSVLSNDHAQGPAATGKYFNFELAEFERVTGLEKLNCMQFMTLNLRTMVVAQAVFWGTSNGGSVGDGHGRYVNTHGQDNLDWVVDDKILLFDKVNARDCA